MEFEKAVRLAPNHAKANNQLAWLLAACADATFRDGERALRHAGKACQWSGHQSWHCLLGLAAAHAETGDFTSARIWAKEARACAPADDKQRCVDALRLFKEKQPLRED